MTTTSSQRLSRLLTLVPWLQTHQGVTLDDCARAFGISVEQLEKDLWLLIVCGIPGYGPDQLVDIQFWDGSIVVLDALTLDAPLRLTPDEAATLSIGLRLLAQVPGIDDRSAIVTAAAKLESIADNTAIAVVTRTDDSVRTAIDNAIDSRMALDIDYAAATSDEVTNRVVLPESVYVVDGNGYLEAWCTAAGARRTFRIDRIASASAVPRPALPAAAGPDDPQPATQVTVTLRPEARWVLDVIPGAVAVGVDSSGATIAQFDVLDLQWAVRLVLSQGSAITAIQPPVLVEMVAAAAAEALRSYA